MNNSDAEKLIRSLPWESFSSDVIEAITVLRSIPDDAADDDELTDLDFAKFENASAVLRDRVTVALYNWEPGGLAN
jgi:hypothetical protein